MSITSSHLSGKFLADAFLKAKEEEKKVINFLIRLLNRETDITLPLDQQGPEYKKKLDAAYEAFFDSEFTFINLARDYEKKLNNGEKSNFWKLITGDETRKNTFDDFTNVVMRKSNLLTENDQKRLLSYGLSLLATTAGGKAIRKFCHYVEKNKGNIEFFFRSENTWRVAQSMLDEEEDQKFTLNKNIHNAVIIPEKNYTSDNVNSLIPYFKKQRANLAKYKLTLEVGKPNMVVFPSVYHLSDKECIFAPLPSFLCFYHELGHANRIFHNSSKYYSIPKSLQIFYKNVEELWNVSLGKTSENVLQKELNIPMRIAYNYYIDLFKSNNVIKIDFNPALKEKVLGKKTIYYNAFYSLKLCAEVFLGRNNFSNLIPKNDLYFYVLLTGDKDQLNASHSKITFGIQNAKLSNAIFQKTDLTTSDFISTSFLNCDFSDTMMEHVALKGETTFQNCNFNHANLSFLKMNELGQAFKNCSFEGATFPFYPFLENMYLKKIISFEDALNYQLNCDAFISGPCSKFADPIDLTEFLYHPSICEFINKKKLSFKEIKTFFENSSSDDIKQLTLNKNNAIDEIKKIIFKEKNTDLNKKF